MGHGASGPLDPPALSPQAAIRVPSEATHRLHERVRDALIEARERTLLLVAGMDPALAGRPAAEYLSPPVWDLGHIANFQEQWLLQRLARAPPRLPAGNDTYDALAHPRPERPGLPLLTMDGVRTYLADVLDETLQRLPEVEMGDDADRLTRAGFVHWMLVLHEHQHQETLLQSFALHGDRYRPQAHALAPGRTSLQGRTASPPPTAHKSLDDEDPAHAHRDGASWCRVPAGAFTMGRAHGPGAYDNEAPAHPVHVDAFDVAAAPATNGHYLEFLESGGYEETAWWSPRGRTWLDDEVHHAPLHWEHRDGVWHRRTIRDGWRPVTEVADEILCHVTFFEAEAYARFRGARLPTEAEWEKACRGPLDQGQRSMGEPRLGNVDHLAWGPSTAGTGGASWCGARHMLGDVWEWCDSPFQSYPGFEAFPYAEYSQVFFGGDYRILRGGSWATRATIATPTFRNWDHPYRRQVFAGIRLARDA